MKNEALVDEWMKFAGMDYDAALYLHRNMRPEPLEIVCFHCQQSAEKALKALLASLDEEIPRIHNLSVLEEQLGTFLVLPEEILDAGEYLTSYAVTVRYPLELGIDPVHVAKAIKYAEKVLAWVKAALDEEKNDRAESSDA